MTISTSSSLQQKRKQLGIRTIIHQQKFANQSKPDLPAAFISPNPIKLFPPRNVVINQKNAVAAKGSKKILKREINFVAAGELTNEHEQAIANTIYLDEEDCIKQENDHSNSSRSPYTAASSSSNATPNSITEELTSVPEPQDVRQKLLQSTKSENVKAEIKKQNKHEVDMLLPSSSSTGLERLIENGYSKSMKGNGSINDNTKAENYNDKQNTRQKPVLNGISPPVPSTSLPVTNNRNVPRKRFLSERGEEESQYPRINRAMIYSDWEGCNLVSIVHIPQIARMVLEGNYENRMCTTYTNQNYKCFHCDLKMHIQRSIQSLHPFRPFWIEQHLKRIFPAHRPSVQEDAHEMLTLLLSALEPNLPKSTQNGLKVDGGIPATPIEQIFGGNLRNEVICNVCRHPHTNYERIRELNLGLNNRNSAVSLAELINDFFKPEQLQNFLCSKCQKKQTATRRTHLLSSPSVLIIQLKRFNQYGGKNRTTVRVKAHISLTQYSYKDENVDYRLHGIIEHIGGGINFGHYICAMRGFDNNFYQFDDSDRKCVNFDWLTRMEPYILFFTKTKRIDNNCSAQQRHSIGSCQPPFPKQERMVGLSPFDSGTKIQNLNRTFSSFIS